MSFITCIQCGITFKTYPSRTNKRKFCSKSCHNKYLIGKPSKCKQERIKKTCRECGKEFWILPRLEKEGLGKFCSKHCSNKYLGKLRIGHTVSQTTREKISKSHMGYKPTKETIKKQSLQKIGNKYRLGKLSSRSERTCIVCNKRFLIKTSSLKHMKCLFCSKACRDAWNRGENHPNWKKGISFLPYCFLFNERRRRAVRIFFGYYCICCGKHVTENLVKRLGQIEHSVHHVDHDKEQGCNGKPFNLVPLCHECHGKEQHHEQEYKDYINKTLECGFEWGIWSKEQYEKEVMYPE